MDEYIFKDWFINEFVPKVRKHLKHLKMPMKAVLVLDNAPTHPQGIECEGDSGIRCFFLPPHETSLIQPMDQGVIECLKRRYRRKLLSDLLADMDLENKGLIDALKSVNIKNVIYMVAKSFDEIPSSTLTKSWKKAWPDVEKAVEINADDNPLANENGETVFDENNDNASLIKTCKNCVTPQILKLATFKNRLVALKRNLEMKF
uniref:DDE-1 domain-containing protein n=1 Tax=Graphocephala atropunctata TaxID=36148 RepID=A0A1B6L7P5_9HEMI